MSTISDGFGAPDLAAVQTLLVVQREGGFSPAARVLGVTRAAVSRTVARLEARLGTRLARRTTRKVVLTEAALGLLERCGAPLGALAEALEAAREAPGVVAGRVRLTGPTAFGRDVLVPVVRAFREAHPAVRVELSLRDHLDDLVAHPIDVAVRLGPLPETTLVARRIGTLPLAVVAARRLVRGRPPGDVAALLALPAVAFRVPATGRLWPWPFVDGGRRHLVEPSHAGLESDSIDAVAAFARVGAGVAVVPRHLVAADLAAGRLVELLPRALGPGPELHVCYGARALMPARVRALVDALLAALPGACTPTRR